MAGKLKRRYQPNNDLEHLIQEHSRSNRQREPRTYQPGLDSSNADTAPTPPPHKCANCGSAAIYYYDGSKALCRSCFDDTMHDQLVSKLAEDAVTVRGILFPRPIDDIVY